MQTFNPSTDRLTRAGLAFNALTCISDIFTDEGDTAPRRPDQSADGRAMRIARAKAYMARAAA